MSSAVSIILRSAALIGSAATLFIALVVIEDLIPISFAKHLFNIALTTLCAGCAMTIFSAGQVGYYFGQKPVIT